MSTRLHELADRLRQFAVGPRPDLREIADELDTLDKLRAGESVSINDLPSPYVAGHVDEQPLTRPPFVRDPLNWEGRVHEQWDRRGERLNGEPERVTMLVVEDEPGRVHVTTDQLRGLLTRAGFERIGDI